MALPKEDAESHRHKTEHLQMALDAVRGLAGIVLKKGKRKESTSGVDKGALSPFLSDRVFFTWE